MDNTVYCAPKDTALVVKHNKLIEAKYRLTLQEKRILLWLMSEIQPGDKDFKKYRVRIADLAAFVGISNDGGRRTAKLLRLRGGCASGKSTSMISIATSPFRRRGSRRRNTVGTREKWKSASPRFLCPICST